MGDHPAREVVKADKADIVGGTPRVVDGVVGEVGVDAMVVCSA